MTEKIFRCPIGNEDYYPVIHVKVDKEETFLYSASLCILLDGESVEICRCDNSHEKGHHIHYCKKNGTEYEEPFKFESIGKTIDFLQSNWKLLLGKYQNGNE